MSLQEMRRKEFDTQDEAAAFFGFKKRTYQNYEIGATSPSMKDAARMARHFGCTIGELFDLEEGAKPELTPEEQTLLADYRCLSAEDRRIVSKVAYSLRTCEEK